MLLNDMIEKLTKLQKEFGNVPVLITDGYNVNCYRGEYEIVALVDFDGQNAVDIGIGGCEE